MEMEITTERKCVAIATNSFLQKGLVQHWTAGHEYSEKRHILGDTSLYIQLYIYDHIHVD